MEENEFRQLYRQVNPDQCVYQKTILSGRYRCAYAQKVNLAEREAVACRDATRYRECKMLVELITEKARFALHRTPDEPITHGQAMKIQQGGLRGLMNALDIESTAINEILDAVRERYETIEQLPFDLIMRDVTQFKLRKKS